MFIAETRKRAKRLMSARLVSPSRNLAQLGGSVDGHCPDGDDRGGSAFVGGVSGYFGLAYHLYQPIRGSWESRLRSRQGPTVRQLPRR